MTTREFLGLRERILADAKARADASEADRRELLALRKLCLQLLGRCGQQCEIIAANVMRKDAPK